MKKKYLLIKDVLAELKAEGISYHPNYVRQLCREGVLKAKRLRDTGSSPILITESSFKEFLRGKSL